VPDTYFQRCSVLATARHSRSSAKTASLNILIHEPNHEKAVVIPSQAAPERQTSLIAVPIYETSPASVGIDGWYGYEEFIPSGTSLPYIKTVTLGSAFDYI